MTGLNAETLLTWYKKNKRDLPWRDTRDPYRIWLSEVMLQQTQVTTVIPYYHRFIEQFPSLEALASAEDETVLKLWEGLGYYNRCHHFLKAVRQANQDCQGQVPDTPESFRSLPGVGPYTAAAVMSIAFGLPMPVVDGNVIRVVTRFYAIGEDITKAAVKKKIEALMAQSISRKNPGDFNQAVMELGATVCTPKTPLCHECPLTKQCLAYRENKTETLPFKPPKPKVPIHSVALALVEEGGRFLIRKRPPRGHLAGLWEFPGGKILKGETPDQALNRTCTRELGIQVAVEKKIATVSHAYTHFKIRLTLFLCRAREREMTPTLNQPLAWIQCGEIGNYPFPAANHKLFPAIKKLLEE